MAGGLVAASDGGVLSEKPPLTWSMILLSVLAALGGFLFGFDTSVISGALLLIKKDFTLTTFEQELVVSLTVAGAFFGSLAGGVLSTNYGRKPSIMVGSVVFIAGAAVLTFAPTWIVLAAGRFVVGLGVGIASATVPTYITESAPAHLRGTLTVINTVCISTGQMVANIVDAAFSTFPHGWRYMFAVSAIPAIIQLVGFLFLPESPRYLTSRGHNKQARKVLQQLRGSEHDVTQELDLMLQASSTKPGGIGQLLSKPHYRSILFLACMMQVINQLTGINCLMYYSSSILKQAGITSDTMTMWISAGIDVAFVFFTVVGLLLVDRSGRRPLMLWSCVAVFGSCLVIAQAFFLANSHSPKTVPPAHAGNLSVTCQQWSSCVQCLDHSSCGFCGTTSPTGHGTCLTFDPSNNVTIGTCNASWFVANSDAPEVLSGFCPNPYAWLAILGLCLYLSSFAFGLTSMPWIINSEIFPTHLRATGNSLATATNWICNLGVSLSFLTLTESITEAGTFWLYAGISVMATVYTYYALPETKAKSLEEIEDMFVRTVNERQMVVKGGKRYQVIQ
eukprot:TRINITY_DN12399_c1_g2_i2.p1 TRINITY_DN12399_c1_g2~~TRINITY_DN12399_c1_g2_i2.p1  ORF type:complete len:563 (+),score=105.39 TRINITY_DN12399_c1_g2_i2:90-1778(+)